VHAHGPPRDPRPALLLLLLLLLLLPLLMLMLLISRMQSVAGHPYLRW
jgi:hypothetical protein